MRVRGLRLAARGLGLGEQRSGCSSAYLSEQARARLNCGLALAPAADWILQLLEL